MLLTDEKIDALIATGNAYRHYDGNGLYIQVSKTGKRYWRYKFRFDGVEKLYSLGKYPETSLAEARQKHSEARESRSRDKSLPNAQCHQAGSCREK